VADTADLNNRRAGEDLREPLMWKKDTVTGGNIKCMQIAERMEHINTDYGRIVTEILHIPSPLTPSVITFS